MYMYCPKCEAKNEDSATTCKNCGYELRSHPSFQPGLSMHVGFWRRLVAYIIDSIILSVIGYIVIIFVALAVTDIEPPYYESYLNSIDWLNLLLSAISIILTLSYYAIMESSPSQATFGKQAMGIIVTDMEGNRISFEKAVKREICKVITVFFFYIGYLAIIFSEKKQGLYDMMVGTVVIYE